LYISETGWAITSTCVGLGMPLNPTPGVTGKPVPGWNGRDNFKYFIEYLTVEWKKRQ
jgi:hypothetical protein